VQSLAVPEAEAAPDSLWDDHGEHDDRNDEQADEDSGFPDHEALRVLKWSVIAVAMRAATTQKKTVPNMRADTTAANS
jgi:hypothetical protein